ncbi:MAG: DNA mismatch repair endonuclease MutL [Bacteroidetes bacterium]|jgi:DNA mismatch repair protein MutL|nr:MAG: DNA mismatch repair endonuclease MutL [Bacteroidota bacterium]UCE68173.1 MAG: DNA mismatch repair endonuclease MutL [Flavobacteriaceae bacterium]
MADRIELLPEHVANQIAAGEVVQRPASVVKELLENAIDAGAGRVRLITKDGGKTLIQVVDDGFGMSPADAGMCIQRHATSKIRKAEDLFHIRTKGFRGEALASIAAIAHLEVLTRRDTDSLGIRLKVAGGKKEAPEEAVCPRGTSVSVKNLFFNIPARRNFLKSPKVEYRHVLEEFQRVALAHPDIAFSLFHNDSELFQLPASNLRKRIVHLFGTRMNNRLVPLEEETQVLQLGGFICKPEFAKKSRGGQFFFVNSRFIKSPYLHHAVMNAYEGLLKPDTVPGYFIFMQVPEDSIDINIHPTKTEIKFEDEQSLYAILRSAIKHSLGQFNIRPVLDFEHDQNLETPYEYKDRGAVMPEVTVDRNFNPFSDTGSSGPTKTYKKALPGGWEALYEGLEAPAGEVGEQSEWVVESDVRTASLFEPDSLKGVNDVFSLQVDRKFILTRVKSGLLLIDQQRAHQRVLYEKFLENLSLSEPASQTLLFPLRCEFSPGEMQVVEEMFESLQAMGFRFGGRKKSSLEIIALPVLIPESEVAGLLDGLIARWQYQDGEMVYSEGDRMARLLARSVATRPGTPLDALSRQTLINDLFACRETQWSPFNKKIHTTLSVEELEKKLD